MQQRGEEESDMRVIAERVWAEPAVAVGLFTSMLLLAISLIDGSGWEASVILGILAPFTSALGIRQLVSPAAGPRPPREHS